LQSEWSLWTRDIEVDVLATARRLGIGIVPFSPLGRGFLTGAITSPDDLGDDDFRKNQPRFQGENFAKNLDLVAAVRALAEDKGCTPGQLALAWVQAKGDDVVPIPGTKRRTYLEENVGALDVELSEADLRRLDEVAPQGVAAGGRYAGTGQLAPGSMYGDSPER
jgi:aryl-alcohol dehydrogenase-like predicted oxidoreductase